MARLNDQVALVTGAGRGLGREIALRLAAEGAYLLVHYASSRQGADEVVKAIAEKGGRAVAYEADIRDRRQVKKLFEQIDNEPGRLDIVVNCSGVSGGGALADLDEDELETMLGINLRGPLYIASEAAKRLGKGGRIINIGSSLAEFPVAGSGVYSATKMALKSMTESWAKELGKKGITVNTVIPGATSPGMMDRAPEQYLKIFENASPFGRIGQAAEIASVVAFLASGEASWVSGAHILANGAANS
jgi:3-oxoacyl-[acyl-carrier protein] reductase